MYGIDTHRTAILCRNGHLDIHSVLVQRNRLPAFRRLVRNNRFIHESRAVRQRIIIFVYFGNKAIYEFSIDIQCFQSGIVRYFNDGFQYVITHIAVGCRNLYHDGIGVALDYCGRRRSGVHQFVCYVVDNGKHRTVGICRIGNRILGFLGIETFHRFSGYLERNQTVLRILAYDEMKHVLVHVA